MTRNIVIYTALVIALISVVTIAIEMNTNAGEVRIAGIAFLIVAVTQVVQAYVEFRTWWMLEHHQGRTALADALKMKSFSLGAKNVAAFLLNALIGAALVAPGTRLFPWEVRIPLYVAVPIFALGAALYGWQFIQLYQAAERRALAASEIERTPNHTDRRG